MGRLLTALQIIKVHSGIFLYGTDKIPQIALFNITHLFSTTRITKKQIAYILSLCLWQQMVSSSNASIGSV